ncbi:hypothetical protein B0J14DRAFT_468551 [Halenospora varia]|nr:hypothetical protein B0J14DRAFT_468551 [Halenospora varia]
MAPLTPSWSQPSHPQIQEVLLTNPNEFTTKSISRITLPPFALLAKMAFPPCTRAEKATYATVQMGRDEHLNLNSDLVYINHSCVPSVIFDTSSLSILAGPNGLKAGEELTFFYPSTEWDMAQGFDCFCGHKECKGKITGAKDMPAEKLEGHFLNAHIRNMLEERDGISEKKEEVNGQNGHGKSSTSNGVNGAQAVVADDSEATVEGEKRRGVTSREMSGEMGGDTVVN